MVRHNLVYYEMVWHDIVCGYCIDLLSCKILELLALKWPNYSYFKFDGIWYGEIYLDILWYGMVSYGMVWHSLWVLSSSTNMLNFRAPGFKMAKLFIFKIWWYLVCYGITWYTMVWYGMTWYSLYVMSSSTIV